MRNGPESFVTNIAYPKSLEEVLFFLERGRFNTEDILAAPSEDGHEEWSVPSWAQMGDIAFFMHSKTSIDTIRRLRRELEAGEYEFDIGVATRLYAALAAAEAIYDQIGGSIFAVGQVCGDVVVDRIAIDEGLHWRNVYYAPIEEIEVFERPAHITEFRSFLRISRTGGITEVDAEAFGKLKELLRASNVLPALVEEAALSA